MPVVRSADAVVHELHGVRFTGYFNSSTGSRELASWLLELPPGTAGPTHVISGEETFYVLAGRLRFGVDGEEVELAAGDAAVAPAGAALAVGNPFAEPARVWVTTRLGLTARMADGGVLTPPWAK